jgi:hypothetical protein
MCEQRIWHYFAAASQGVQRPAQIGGVPQRDGCGDERQALARCCCSSAVRSRKRPRRWKHTARESAFRLSPLFQTYRRKAGQLTGNPLPQANAYAIIQRRAKSGGITTQVGNHTFRATGVTAYLRNGGMLEKAALMANHASTRTAQLYDRREEEVTLDEVERVPILLSSVIPCRA